MVDDGAIPWLRDGAQKATPRGSKGLFASAPANADALGWQSNHGHQLAIIIIEFIQSYDDNSVVVNKFCENKNWPGG